MKTKQFIMEPWKRDGYPCLEAYQYFRWGKAFCEYCTQPELNHPQFWPAKRALYWAEQNPEIVAEVQRRQA